jgi:hypothetical protein
MDFKAGSSGTITVISATPEEASGWRKTGDFVADAFTKVGARSVTVHNVKEMAIKVVAMADGGKIDRLNITGHGNDEGCLIGKDFVTDKSFGNFAQDLIPIVG